MSDKTQNESADANKGDEEIQYEVLEIDESGQPLPAENNAAADDAANKGADDDDDEDDDDERAGHAEGDQDDNTAYAGESEDERRERRRRENRAKRTRNRAAAAHKDRLIESMGKSLIDMQEQIATLNGRSIQYDENLLKGRLAGIENQQAEAKRVMAKLVKAGDGEGIAEVTELQISLRDQKRHTEELLRRAAHAREQIQRGRKGEENDGEDQDTDRSPPAPRIDPEVKRLGSDWAKSNPWLTKATKEDVDIVKVIDANLSREGFNPTDPDYWAELTSRVKRRLPHHFQQKQQPRTNGNGREPVVTQQNNNRPSTGGPRMASTSQTRVPTKNQVRVSPARKQAMIDAGKWDDPVKRNRQLAAYAKYDAEHAE